MMKRNQIRLSVLGVVLGFTALGCGGAATTGGAGGGGAGGAGGGGGGPVVTAEARADFAKAAAAYTAAAQGGWTKEECVAVANGFQDVADDHGNLIEALYNVGATYRVCGMKDEAKKAFAAARSVNGKHQPTLTQLAVYELEAGNEDAATELLKTIISSGANEVTAVPAYTNAATLQRNRKDSKKAQQNLRRALAIESKYMPALYQLAMLYSDVARETKKVSYYTLARLVCDQAIQIDPEYGPIFHAMGEILLAQNDLVEALKAFEAAFTKDPSLFESYMNYAAINLNFRGYESAKAAFEKAIALKPQSYDAHMGLGVAMRGLGDFQGARAEYKKAAEIDPKRTDFIFNVGLLEMDYENDGTPAGYDKARGVFEKFLQNATDEHKVDPDDKGPILSWYAKAEQRIAACNKAVEQIKEAERQMAEMQKLQQEQRDREEEAKKMMEKAKELEEKEKAGAVAPGGVDGEGLPADGAAPPAAPAEEKKDAAAPAEAPKADEKKDAAAPAETPKADEKKDAAAPAEENKK